MKMSANQSKKIFLIFFLCIITSGHSQSPNQTAQKTSFEIDYLLSLPQGYKEDSLKKWPLLIFLHGGGECGDDIEKVKTHGPPKLIEQGVKFPFIVASPQAKAWFKWEPDVLYRFVGNLMQHYQVDRDRIYLTGLSLGGDGTWKFAIAHPELFAAIVPICGSGDTTETWKLRNVAVWAFHGALDDIVPAHEGEIMIKSLKKYNPKARFTLYPDANHNSWERTYANDSLYSWLLAQKRKQPAAIKLSANTLRKYEGKYVAGKGDTLTLKFTDGRLRTTFFNEEFDLSAASEKDFFVEQLEGTHLSFETGSSGIKAMTVFSEKKKYYKKVSARK